MNRMLRFLHIDLIAIAILLLSCTPEDTDSPAPEDFFVKYYGTTDVEVMIDVQAYDGGYLLLGSTENATNKDLLLIKTDFLGSKLWEQKIGFSYNGITNANADDPSDTPGEMIIYDSLHVAIIGTTEFTLGTEGINATRLFVALVNVKSNSADGAILKSENLIFPAIPIGLTDDSIRNANTTGSSLLRPLANGQIENALILLGGSAVNAVGDDSDIYMHKINVTIGDGSTTVASTWPQYLGYEGFDTGVRVLQNDNEDFNLIATTDRSSGSTGGGLNIDFYTVDIDGNVPTFTNIGYPGDTDEIAADISVNGGRTTILGNSSDGTAFILEFVVGDASQRIGPVVIDFKIIDDGTGSIYKDTGNVGNGIVKLESGDFFVTGQITNFTDDQNINKQGDIVLYKIDQDGALIENSVRTYGGTGNDIGQAIIQNNDRSLMIGATMDFNGGLTMMSLIKTDFKGELAK